MAWVQRHWPVLWCAWASQCSSGHVGQVEGSSRASGGFGHGGGLPMTLAASVWGLWPQRGVTVGCVGSYGSVWTQRGRLELKAGLPVSRWPVGTSRRPRRHGDDGEAHGCTTGLQRGGHGVRVSYPWLQRTGWARQGDARRLQRTWPWWSRHGGGDAPTVAWCGLRGPPVTYVFTDRERGVFRGEKVPAKVVASLLLR